MNSNDFLQKVSGLGIVGIAASMLAGRLARLRAARSLAKNTGGMARILAGLSAGKAGVKGKFFGTVLPKGVKKFLAGAYGDSYVRGAKKALSGTKGLSSAIYNMELPSATIKRLKQRAGKKYIMV